ncbi:formyltetrahydrofolate deformylase [Alkalicoccobacillus porphyridii]|uniref:Formyltetrahydrofolate deformylase n=1 Tax=Alkalicoccobacillus porphyridii TaxID=2597270 RepID=A0A554A332_9BACI|nr:formyltetrahydrofolate deformylase [Alkalicoccobacillus porphyridii]TSB48104.1 formyltetrahydrofolate deformylase [Alkalicoccobacillus porphyridii]
MTHLIPDNRGRLLVACSDQPGIVASISSYLQQQGANIVQSDQYTTDPEGGMFFMRIEFDWSTERNSFLEIKEGFKKVAADFQFDWRMEQAVRKKRMVIFVSKESHCLLELLWKWKANELHVEIPLVISNHADHQKEVESYGIPFHHIPVEKGKKQEAEKRAIELIKEHDIDFVVLARYMQILSPTFVQTFAHKIINIHHSFLPAFIGANPYAKAFERGVKLIGATAHYVTDDLDEGPIIEQDIMRVNHRYSSEDLRIAGRNVERVALARAVMWHHEDRVIIHGNKTVVFS